MSKKSTSCAICALESERCKHSTKGHALVYNTERFGRICHPCYLRIRARLRKNPSATDAELRAPSRLQRAQSNRKRLQKVLEHTPTLAEAARKTRIPYHSVRYLTSKRHNTLR